MFERVCERERECVYNCECVCVCVFVCVFVFVCERERVCDEVTRRSAQHCVRSIVRLLRQLLKNNLSVSRSRICLWSQADFVREKEGKER